MSEQTKTIEMRAALQYRKDHFAVEVKPARFPGGPDEVSLSITHNGYQWQSICLLPEEVAAVVEKLREFIPSTKDIGPQTARS